MLPPIGRGQDGTGGTRGHDNPFQLPNEDEVFRMREMEKQMKEEERLHNLHQSVADKNTFSSRMSTMRVSKIKEEIDGGDKKSHKGGTTNLATQVTQTLMPTDARKLLQSENMADFISRKREIFLVQMSLDTKRAEIRKLEERAAQREAALKKSDLMLERDAERFDAFLRENDEKVQEAMKRAEIESRAKIDKMAQIKKLNNQIAAVRSELNKQEELLDDCHRYKAFLSQLTPVEWFKEQEEKKARIKEARIARWKGECVAIQEKKDEAKQRKVELEDLIVNARSQQEYEQAQKDLADATEHLAQMDKLAMPPEPSKELSEAEWQEPMYFTKPRQLLEVFAQLEEQNLFLIQNAQELDEMLEAMKVKLNDTKSRMGGEVSALEEEIVELNEQIGNEEAKSHLFEKMAKQRAESAMVGASSGITLDDISSKVRDVYIQSGFESDASVGTLQMLTNIETKLEEYLAAIKDIPPEFLQEAEKAREKERRQKAREEKLEQVKAEQAERVKHVLARAYAAPANKPKGKPVMFRSVLAKKKKVDTGPIKDPEEIELEDYLARADF